MLNKEGCILLLQELYLWVGNEVQLALCCVTALWNVFGPVLDMIFCCLLSSAEHASHLPLHGPRAGHEHVPPSLAVPVGVLHGDWLRLVGHPSPRPTQHGPEPGGEAA